MTKIELESMVRRNIMLFQPYSTARMEYSGSGGIFLDANENPFGTFNRYPDLQQMELKRKIAEIKSVSANKLFISNGSDEAIDLLMRVFCRPGTDSIIVCPPSYGMYEVLANINDVEICRVPLDRNFQPDKIAIINAGSKCLSQDGGKVKMLFLCSPNNPTGNNLNNIEKIAERFDGIVVVDEAYIDFSSADSMISKTDLYPNLVVLQTLSKAWGLAAARVGMAIANETVISLLNKIKPPYNVSLPNQMAALNALDDIRGFEKRKNLIIEQREWLLAQLKNIQCVRKVYPSDANFFLVEVNGADLIHRRLTEKKIITRNRSNYVKDCLRITVGSPVENIILIEELKKIML